MNRTRLSSAPIAAVIDRVAIIAVEGVRIGFCLQLPLVGALVG